jgi:hypothetical protein
MPRFEQSTYGAVVGVAMSLVVALLLSAVAVEARTHGARRATVPDIVARTLPAVVSINTRYIERDQFGQGSQ